ncbi:DUF6114 domain-containing protein [Streptomyces katrae]|uniref:DUF6114 domain-containing protein n=1 Tax=Streptomyces katrae TaxID=68223 RepID=UPI000AEB656A|nr:DUF6114 domain-containing protein [Streptomyces katrae]
MLLSPRLRLPWAQRRRRLRAWRWTRPFWGGLPVLLGGAALPLTVLVSLGLGGIAAVGIGAALMAAGLFLWFVPQARAYVCVHALLVSVLSFVATNLAVSSPACCSGSPGAHRPSGGRRCPAGRRTRRVRTRRARTRSSRAAAGRAPWPPCCRCCRRPRW